MLKSVERRLNSDASCPSPRVREEGVIASVIIWIVAIALAAMLDARGAAFVRSSGLEEFFRDHRWLAAALKSPGTYYFTIAIAAIVLFARRDKWRSAVFILLATAVSGVNGAVKWIVGRHRPFKSPDEMGQLTPFEFHPFAHESKNLCFPSGHACLAFATAAALGFLWPRWRWAFYLGAAIVAFERVAENAHWLSDSVAAAALGIAGVFLIRMILARQLLSARR